jgi:hypothetical protein
VTLALARTQTLVLYVLVELIGAYHPGFKSSAQPPLDELVVCARDHEPACTTAADRANVEPQ